jgi:hypothetical protein
VLAEFMVMWRSENMLLNRCFNWILKMLQAMYCYQTCVLLMATGISVRMFNDRKEKKFAETASLHLD